MTNITCVYGPRKGVFWLSATCLALAALALLALVVLVPATQWLGWVARFGPFWVALVYQGVIDLRTECRLEPERLTATGLFRSRSIRWEEVDRLVMHGSRRMHLVNSNGDYVAIKDTVDDFEGLISQARERLGDRVTAIRSAPLLIAIDHVCVRRLWIGVALLLTSGGGLLLGNEWTGFARSWWMYSVAFGLFTGAVAWYMKFYEWKSNFRQGAHEQPATVWIGGLFGFAAWILAFDAVKHTSGASSLLTQLGFASAFLISLHTIRLCMSGPVRKFTSAYEARNAVDRVAPEGTKNQTAQSHGLIGWWIEWMAHETYMMARYRRCAFWVRLWHLIGGAPGPLLEYEGLVAWKSEKWQRAIEKFKVALRTEGADVALSRERLAFCMAEDSRVPEAIVVANRVMILGFASEDFPVEFGVKLRNAEAPHEALSWLEPVSSSKNDEVATLFAAHCYFDLAEYEKACALYSKLSECSSEPYMILSGAAGIACVLARQGSVRAAIEAVDAGLAKADLTATKGTEQLKYPDLTGPLEWAKGLRDSLIEEIPSPSDEDLTPAAQSSDPASAKQRIAVSFAKDCRVAAAMTAAKELEALGQATQSFAADFGVALSEARALSEALAWLERARPSRNEKAQLHEAHCRGALADYETASRLYSELTDSSAEPYIVISAATGLAWTLARLGNHQGGVDAVSGGLARAAQLTKQKDASHASHDIKNARKHAKKMRDWLKERITALALPFTHK
ncbi:MAG: PH domain-containing protein [Acidobacteria bacterium]|nr:MAG: PH domain-containing protein [Acidobacteriota bacterium]